MAVAIMVDNPRARRRSSIVRERLGMEDAAGGIFPSAGPRPNGGWRVIEVWESEEDAKRFVNERMLPAFEALGPTTASAPLLARAQLHGIASPQHRS